METPEVRKLRRIASYWGFVAGFKGGFAAAWEQVETPFYERSEWNFGPEDCDEELRLKRPPVPRGASEHRGLNWRETEPESYRDGYEEGWKAGWDACYEAAQAMLREFEDEEAAADIDDIIAEEEGGGRSTSRWDLPTAARKRSLEKALDDLTGFDRWGVGGTDECADEDDTE